MAAEAAVPSPIAVSAGDRLPWGSMGAPPSTPTPTQGSNQASSLRELSVEFLKTEAQIKLGGGKKAIDRQHEKGRLTAREPT